MRMSQLVPSKFDDTHPVRVAGTIRPGIRRLTAAGRENPKAVAIYRDGVARGESFKVIADAIEKATGKTMTTPTNVPYFTVREGDFLVKEIARKILDQYGENETIEGVVTRVVKRLPVQMYGDTVEECLDYQYKTFGASGLQFWSAEASEDDVATVKGIRVGDRVCKKLAEMPKRADGKAVRAPGGREPEVRGLCRPTTCPEYQSGKCRMRGKLFFYVPGSGVSAPIAMPISSTTFGIEAEDTLERIRRDTGGNLTRFATPVFFLAKEKREIGMLDEDGKPKRVTQFITVLEAMVDVPMLRMQRFDVNPGAANSAAVALGALPRSVTDSAHGAAQQALSAPESSDDIGVAGEPASPAQTLATIPPATATSAVPSVDGLASSDDSEARPPSISEPPKSQGQKLQAEVARLAKASGMTEIHRFTTWAKATIGGDWQKSVDGLTTAIERLTAIAEPRAALVAALTEKGMTIEQWLVDDPDPPFWDFTPDGITERLQAFAT